MSLLRLKEKVMYLRSEATDELSQELLDIIDGIIAEIDKANEVIDELIEILEELIEETIESGDVEVRIR